LAGEGGSQAPSPLVGAGSGACFAASPDIRHAEVEGLRVLLDLRTESYRVLNEAGSAMWSVLTGEADELAALGSLERRYCADLDRLHSDLASFARRLLAEGVFAPAGEASEASPEAASAQARGACFGEAGGRPPPPPRVNETLLPLSGLGRGVAIFEALSALTATWFALARSGFAPTYRAHAKFRAAPARAELQSVLAAFRRAENLFLLRRAPNDCVVRSLALYRFVCSYGIAAEHVIGVQRIPFKAHAWVEWRGEPLLDAPVHGFTSLARLGAPG
jgi:hypothetical protein